MENCHVWVIRKGVQWVLFNGKFLWWVCCCQLCFKVSLAYQEIDYEFDVWSASTTGRRRKTRQFYVLIGWNNFKSSMEVVWKINFQYQNDSLCRQKQFTIKIIPQNNR